jgi:hypothetical protein
VINSKNYKKNKEEYARLYGKTMSYLITDYIEDNYDAMGSQTLDSQVDFLTPAKEDKAFLFVLVKNNTTQKPLDYLEPPTHFFLILQLFLVIPTLQS